MAEVFDGSHQSPEAGARRRRRKTPPGAKFPARRPGFSLLGGLEPCGSGGFSHSSLKNQGQLRYARQPRK